MIVGSMESIFPERNGIIGYTTTIQQGKNTFLDSMTTLYHEMIVIVNFMARLQHKMNMMVYPIETMKELNAINVFPTSRTIFLNKVHVDTYIIHSCIWGTKYDTSQLWVGSILTDDPATSADTKTASAHAAHKRVSRFVDRLAYTTVKAFLYIVC